MNSPIYIIYATYGLIGLCILFALAGAIHGFVFWGADCVRISGILNFAFYAWNFYSNIAFALELLNYEDIHYLFYICLVFIVVPWIANMISLMKYQNTVCEDDAIRERVYSWLVSWQIWTYALAAASGSAFGTVELANSYVFGLDFFCMGLNERHLMRFNMNRLWSTHILGDLPQLIVQLWFLSTVDWKPENEVVWLAMCSSFVSAMGCLEIYSAKKSFKVLDSMDSVLCSIHILGEEIKENAKRLQVSTYALRDTIAETLITHAISVEIHFPLTTADGFKVAFTVFTSKLEPDVIYSRLRENVSSSADTEAELPEKIRNAWRLQTVPSVPLQYVVVTGADVEVVNTKKGRFDTLQEESRCSF